MPNPNLWEAGRDIVVATGTLFTGWVGIRVSQFANWVWKSKVSDDFYRQDQERRQKEWERHVDEVAAAVRKAFLDADHEVEYRIETNNNIRAAQMTARLDIIDARMERVVDSIGDVHDLAEKLLDATLGRRNGAK